MIAVESSSSNGACQQLTKRNEILNGRYYKRQQLQKTRHREFIGALPPPDADGDAIFIKSLAAFVMRLLLFSNWLFC